MSDSPDRPELRGPDVTAVSALDEPNRRRLYDYVCEQAGSVTRDDACAALAMPRQTVAFHLDKLADVGLLDVTFARRTGRSGPGAGRPAKLYHRSGREIAVRLPHRSYEVVGELLADAVEEADATGESPRTVLARNAARLGRDLGAGTGAQDAELLATLSRCGYEPRQDGADIALVNCPFHRLAQSHTELVCGMNLSLIDALVGSTGNRGRCARLDPREGFCCVRIGAVQ